MAGDPTNVSLWTDADVMVGPLTAPNPATVEDPWPAEWGLVGLLDGDDGMPESRDEDTSDMFAWGGILVRTSRRNFKLTKKFGALEDNPTTRALIWPGSTSSALIIPRPVPVKVGFEVRDGESGRIERLITRRHAIITVDGDIDKNETDLSKVTLAAVIFPDGGGTLFDRQFVPVVQSLAVTPSPATATIGGTQQLTATATYDDASTQNVTASAAWTSGTPADATVSSAGLVTGVAAGTSVITAVFDGVSGSSTVTVS